MNPIGSLTRPVYVNARGVAVPCEETVPEEERYLVSEDHTIDLAFRDENNSFMGYTE